MHKLSVIIPVLNEEDNLKKLFKALKAQKGVQLDVIVADAGSSDNTVAVAKSNGATVVKGGLPAKGRNNGIRNAKYPEVVFLDADVTFPETYLANCIGYMKEHNLKVAGVLTYPESTKVVDRFYYTVWNFYVWATQKVFPHAAGYCIFSNKNVHEKIHGFDEKIRLGEDSNYVLKASKVAQFGIIPHKIYASVRRLETEGRLKLAIKMFLCAWYRIFGKEDRNNIFNYNFNNHKTRKL